jgi:hypothetical protein
MKREPFADRDVITGQRLTPTQVKKLRGNLKRHGESDIKKGTCRKVAKGVTICRLNTGAYVRTTKRHVPRSQQW